MKPLIEKKRRGWKLNRLQREMIRSYESKVADGEYAMRALPCLCGAHDDVLIADTDRFGININTVICKNCGLVRSDPYYDDETLGKFYDSEYRPLYSGSVYEDDGFMKWFYADQMQKGERFAKDLEKEIGGLSGKRVYEIGCGAGGIIAGIAKSGAYGSKYVEYGRTRGGGDLHVGGIAALTHLPKADAVIMIDVLEHVTGPLEMLEQIKSILAPGGIFLCNCPDFDNISINGDYGGDIFNGLQNAHCWWFSEKTLARTLSQSGFHATGTPRIFRLDDKAKPIPADKGYCGRELKYLEDLESKRKRKTLADFVGIFIPLRGIRRWAKKRIWGHMQ